MSPGAGCHELPATQEAAAKRLQVGGQRGKLSKTLSQNKSKEKG